MILDIVVVLIRKAEVVRQGALLVIDDLGVGVEEAHLGGGLDLVVAVLRDADVRGHLVAVLDPDGDVLPVVLVAHAARPVDGLVLLEVVAVDEAAPAVVAPRPRVHVVVLQVRQVPAVPVLGPAAVQPRRHVARRVDRRSVVAPVCVEVHCCARRCVRSRACGWIYTCVCVCVAGAREGYNYLAAISCPRLLSSLGAPWAGHA